MNDINTISNINVESMIYEIRGKQVMLDSEIYVAKWHDYSYDKIITHYDIGKPISVFIKSKF